MEILQYANSPRISQLLDDIKYYFNDENFWDDFYTKIWNIETATKIGLDIWGAIVNIPRNLDTDEGIYSLSDEQYRKVILLKAFANIAATVPETFNRVLRTLFEDRGLCFCHDLGEMSMSYVFMFKLEAWEKALFKAKDILPRPAGVLIALIELDEPVLWFEEAFTYDTIEPLMVETFDNAPFFENRITILNN